MRILVKRTGAFGDVVDTTPILRRLRKENPDAVIDVLTCYPQVYAGSPHRIGVRPRANPQDYDRVIDLDLAFENRLGEVPAPEAYMEVAFGDQKGPLWLEIHFKRDLDLPVDWSKVVVIYPARSWPQRTLPLTFWKKAAQLLIEAGWTVISTGTMQDWPINTAGTMDMRALLSMPGQLALISKARAMLAGSSGLMIAAQATDTPIVSMETMTKGSFAARERHGVKGWRYYPIEADIECVGCYHRLGKPVTYFDCPLGTNACVNTFSPEKAVEKVNEAIRLAAQDDHDMETMLAD